MTKYRDGLPQLRDRLFLTDGGIETTLIFHEGLTLPDFAAFHLLQTPEGVDALRRYFRAYADVARSHGMGLVLESPTWRASTDWGARLGYTATSLAGANRDAIRLLEEIRAAYETDRMPVVISGCVGPRGDGYLPENAMSANDAETYHLQQIEVFASSAVDMVCAITINYAEEAVGIARAAERMRMPVALSFTVETDGNLPTGQSLASAVQQVDAATGGYPAYYMINCAHPTHFAHLFDDDRRWQRIRGVRANASRRSHAELNDSTELDTGNPAELGREYAELAKRLPNLTVMGGCCGTDHRHVEQIAVACSPLFPVAR
jgi:homocysteine S-methyltransferase